jgi:hypothetical protein
MNTIAKNKQLLEDCTVLLYLDSYDYDMLYNEGSFFIEQLCLRIKYHNFVNMNFLRLISIPELLKLYNAK